MPAHALYERHRPLLDDALQALSRRGHWSPFPEAPSPKVYGETAQAQGHAAVQALFGKDYPLRQPGERARVATEQSPYGVALDIRYPECDAQALVDAAQAAEPAWQALGPQGRTGVLVEALRDVQFLVAPFSARQALDALARLSIALAFAAVRGMPAVELDAVAAMMVRLGDWMLAQGGRVQSVDANPVLVARGAQAPVIVDAVVAVAAAPAVSSEAA